MIEPPSGARDDADDAVLYDLSDWTPEQRAELDRSLIAEGVTHRWEPVEAQAPSAMAGQLLVSEAEADLVEELIDEIDHPDALEPVDDTGDDAGAQVLSTLYVASDVLLGAPSQLAAADEAREAAAAASSMPAPYGLDEATWADVRRRAEVLADALGDGDEEQIAAAARGLREAVRQLV